MHDPDMGDRAYTYHPDGTLATQTDAKGQQTAFSYAAAGNTDSVNGETQHFTYDRRDRLTHAWTTGSATFAYDESYTYNAIGNITGKGPTGSLSAYGYNPSGAGSVRPHAATSVGSQAYQYDANGNMTGRNGKTIAWHADNTLASMADRYPGRCSGQNSWGDVRPLRVLRVGR